MIKFLLKFFLYGGLYFFLFSIPISDTPIFYRLEVYTRPYTSRIFEHCEEFIEKHFSQVTKWVPKFFSNARPPIEQINDTTKIMEDHQKVVEDLSDTLHK